MENLQRNLQRFQLPFTIRRAPVTGKRAITAEEHTAVIQREQNAERRDFYVLLWHTGAAQSDGRTLDAGFREFLPGYAITSYGSKGKTVDFVLFSDSAVRAATDRRQWYVTISPGRRGIGIFTPDKEQLRENVIRSGDQPPALDLVAGRVRELLSQRAGNKRWGRWLKAWSARAQSLFIRAWQTTKKPPIQDQVYGQQTT